jgi:PAS domain S-box-containing protein
MNNFENNDIWGDISIGAERYKRLVEGSLDIVYIFSNKRGGLYWSPRVKDVLGYEVESLKKNRFLWYESIHSDDKGNVDRAILEFSKGRGFSIEYRIKDKSGNWHWLFDRFIGKLKEKDEIIIEGLATDITERKNAEIELMEKNLELERLVSEIRTLRGIIPICANCKKIRTDKGAWTRFEAYISEHSYAEFSHGICPTCKKKLYPDMGS